MKKAFFVVGISFCISSYLFSQNIGIGTATPNASAQLDITSTTKGLLIPRMTLSQRTAIPPHLLQVYWCTSPILPTAAFTGTMDWLG